MIRAGRSALAVVAILFGFALVAAPVYSITQNGGPGDDDLVGLDNESDTLRGGGGCDDIKGLGQGDNLFGGNGTCDSVRGGDGWDDRVTTWDDDVGGDSAYGGAGNRDVCRVDPGDHPDVATCEEMPF
jgi:hypothetical protein